MQSRYCYALAALLIALPSVASTQSAAVARPFGTLREQADTQQRWLASRMATVLPAVMRKYAVDMWVIPMREYNEDPVFTSIVSPTTFAARRRTIYVFSMRGDSVERIALGGSSQGGVYTAIRSTKAASEPVGQARQRNAELWGDEQWTALKKVIEERNPRNIAVNVSRVFAFSDGLSAGEMEGMREALGGKWTSRFVRHDGLAVDLIATRLPEEAAFYRSMQELVWAIIDTAFSARVITPGVTRTDDVVWWFRQRVNDLGLGSWFQPSVSIQRRGVLDDNLGPNPVIQRGDVLHCDFGIVALRLATDTQHMGYVLRDGEAAPPAGLVAAFRNGNRLQDIVMEEVKPGRTGNEVLKSSLARMRAAGIEGTVYTHPIGIHGHGAGPLIGLWDYQDGVPGRGDAKIIPSMWFSIELQATSPVPEWNGQRVRMALEEDMTIDASGRNAWALKRQTEFHLVRAQPRDSIRSVLRTVDIQSGSIETVYSADRHFEAPNWSPDGRFFVVNSKGRLYRLPAHGDKRLEEIPTGFATQANNDHGISPDGRYLVLSHHAKEHITDPAQDWLASSIYIVPITGGSTPVKVTTKAPSFWHGWSPDGKTLAYVGRRNDEWDIYTIPVEGGEERRLTSCRGLDDGPDYSFDGKFIYYNSFCSGSMQIWRMNADGSKPEQLTRDAYSNWFPHPSPDGRWVVFISYLEDQGEGHPFGKQVKLRLMDIRDGSVRDLTQPFFGGQGTINVPSWSPDSRRVAFVVYEIH